MTNNKSEQLRRHENRSVHITSAIYSDPRHLGNHESSPLDGQEPGPRNVNSMCAPEMFDGGTDGGLELDDGLAGIRGLVIDNDLEVHPVTLHDSLDGLEVDPQADSCRVFEGTQ